MLQSSIRHRLSYHLGPQEHLSLTGARTLPQKQCLRRDFADRCRSALASSNKSCWSWSAGQRNLMAEETKQKNKEKRTSLWVYLGFHFLSRCFYFVENAPFWGFAVKMTLGWLSHWVKRKAPVDPQTDLSGGGDGHIMVGDLFHWRKMKNYTNKVFQNYEKM